MDSGYAYHLLPIFLTIIITYGITYILSARKVISTLLHRRIWNFVLMVSAIAMLILALLLTMGIEYGLFIPLPFDIIFWHVEAGIVMGIIAALHIAWHWRYFFRLKPTMRNNDN